VKIYYKNRKKKFQSKIDLKFSCLFERILFLYATYNNKNFQIEKKKNGWRYIFFEYRKKI